MTERSGCGIGPDCVCLSINSIKAYIRSVYRKIRVKNRVEAVLWGVAHGFSPDIIGSTIGVGPIGVGPTSPALTERSGAALHA